MTSTLYVYQDGNGFFNDANNEPIFTASIRVLHWSADAATVARAEFYAWADSMQLSVVVVR